MDNKKKNMPGKWVFILILAVCCFIIPFILNLLFKKTSNSNYFIAEWGAGDALNFYGTLVSSIGSIFLGYAALILNKKSNEISDRLYILEKTTKENDIRPFVMISNFYAVVESIIDIVLEPQKIYIDVGESEQNKYDNCLCLSVFFTNTGFSYATVEFNEAVVYDNDNIISTWRFTTANQSNPKLYLNTGEVGEIVFYSNIDKMKELDSKEIIMKMNLMNRFGKLYVEKFIISPIILSNYGNGRWYVHLDVHGYTVELT